MAIEFKKSEYTTNVVDGVATVTYGDKNVFTEGSELSKDILNKTFKYTNEFISATTDEAANLATEMLKKDKSVEKVIIDYPFGPTGSGAVTANIARSKTFKIPGTENSITRPDIGIAVKHTLLKASKSHVKSLQQTMLEALR